MCSYLYPYCKFTRYWLNGDTLIIKNEPRKSLSIQQNGFYSFTVEKKDKNTIAIKPLSSSSISIFRKFEEFGFSSEIELKRTTKKNDFRFDRIGFISEGCLGTFGRLYLEIDENGNLFFHGWRDSKKVGFYTGKLSTEGLEEINEKLNALQLDSLKTYYWDGWSDPPLCGLNVKVGNNFYKSSAFGNYKEPAELRFLLNKLMEVCKIADLKKDSTLMTKFQFKEFMSTLEPPPPPPPFEKH
jgi:hypothetical protein